MLPKKYLIFGLALISIGAYGLQTESLSVSANTVSALSSVPVGTEIAVDLPDAVLTSSEQPSDASVERAVPIADSTVAPLRIQQAPTPIAKPTRLVIPSINLDNRVIPVGVNSKGEMDVPDGKTKDIGWYKGGPRPGERGSAVLDAHVYAAFADLRYVKVGDEIIVEMENGRSVRFIVEESTVYKLGDLSPQLLFNRNDKKRLNLITCAGKPTADGSTYTHRLVVYAVYAGDL